MTEPTQSTGTSMTLAVLAIARRQRMSSLDVPVLEDAADLIDRLTAVNADMLAALKIVQEVYGRNEIPEVDAAIARAEAM